MGEQNEQNEQKSVFDDLNSEYQKAIELRLKGFTHAAIANILFKSGYKVKEHTVRVWFMKGGKCNEVFSQLRKQRMDELAESLTELDFQIKSAVVDSMAIILTVLDQALSSDVITPLQLKVAQDMLDRGGVPKQTKVDSDTFINIGKEDAMNNMANSIKLALTPHNPST